MGRNNRRGGGAPPRGSGGGGLREAALVRVGNILEEFRASDSNVYTFETGLSKQERAAIHEMCRKMGMISKSSGKGANRQLSVYKIKKNQGANRNDEEMVTRLTFSEEARNVLRDLFVNYPPDDGDLNECSLRNPSKKSSKAQPNQDSSFCKPQMKKSDIAKKVELLASRIKESEQLQKISEDKAKLPIASFKDVITSTLENHQVVLISGETGCGKTTQVPQYILDHMWGKGESCKIVCTQPRRISAISVSERISFERGESVGETVGYKIRLESKGGKNSSIMFCTNGILLRLLISRGANSSNPQTVKNLKDDSLMGITHVIVDEIHERDRFSDFMLAILRDLLPAYPHLRLVLMSATIDADRFSRYFNGCPIIQVPGFTYPVKTFYLEDILSILRSTHDNHLDPSTEVKDKPLVEDYQNALDESISLALLNDEIDPLLNLISSDQNPRIHNYRHSLSGVTPLMVFASKGDLGNVCMLLSLGADCSLRDNESRSAADWAQGENHTDVIEVLKKHSEKDASNSVQEEELLNKYLSSINLEHIDTVLIERLLRKICTDSKEGAILVFLPGWEDINQTRERLISSHFFKDETKFNILSLHSMIPSSEQKKVFKRLAGGVRKIILSTNIAETAVTIDDVVFVVDSGRMKEKSYDPYNNVSTLQSSWVSKANARQRVGRAGRCQPGICYHLYSKFRASSMPDFQVPEIKRMPIEELCLQVKLLDPNCQIAEFLNKTLDPPVPETVRNAITVLQDLGALTLDETLTELGERLGSLPVHPSTSKMLLFAILINCLDPALTLACASDYRDPFVLPVQPDQRRRAAAAKAELAAVYGGSSDELAVVAAFDCWRRAHDRGQESQFCAKYFVSSTTMNMLFNMRRQLQSELAKNGFIPQDSSGCSLNAQDPGILRAVLMAGAYPMVGRILPKRKNNKRPIVETASGAKVRLHSHSSNFNLSLNRSSPLIVYDEITRGDGGMMYIKSCSLVGPYPLLLLATELAVVPLCDDDPDVASEDWSEEEGSENGEDGEGDEIEGSKAEDIMGDPDNEVAVVVDRWLRFESTALDVAQIYCLRERLASAMLFKVKNPKAVLPPALGASMQAISGILSYEGLPSPTQDNPAGPTQIGGYLRSLLSDKPYHNNYNNNFDNSYNNNNNNGAHFHKNRRQMNPNRSGVPPLDGPGSGSLGALGNRSFKRHREGGPR